jgi:hypothetical protein
MGSEAAFRFVASGLSVLFKPSAIQFVLDHSGYDCVREIVEVRVNVAIKYSGCG